MPLSSGTSRFPVPLDKGNEGSGKEIGPVQPGVSGSLPSKPISPNGSIFDDAFSAIFSGLVSAPFTLPKTYD